MNGTASAKATNELVGKPGRRVSAFRPPELTASSIIGKSSGAITFAGCRIVRTTDRRASRKTWSASTLIGQPRERFVGPRDESRREFSSQTGRVACSNCFCGELSARRLGFVLVGSLQRAACLRQEHVVESRLVQPQVCDLDSRVVERPDDVREVGL